MPILHFTTPDGQHVELEASEGLSVMEVAVNANIPGIDADCGGACACATCHVYVDKEWLERLPPRTDTEVQMLEFAAHVQPTSRLSCRLIVSPELDGLSVCIPTSQY